MRKTLCGSLVSLLMFSSMSVQADDAAVLKSKLSQIDNLKANFSQTVTDLNQKVIQTGKGVLALAFPNRFYWHLTEPDESLIVADGSDVWIYNPFAEEVTVMDVNQAINASPIALLVHRDEKTWSQYQVKQQGECYNIKPLNVDAAMSSVEVCFNGQSLTEIVLDDQQGNVSQFRLSNQTTLTKAESSLFTFILPDGVDVDDQRLHAAQ
ncbi:outer membrane lipoprotein chaperone LolA [Shewanella surugensis]|uniref:Outer-membrane lipoprotein carrier protein n=1 Tax=Shewanella surugensis TaxID=212020 RepID=A0ABT0LH40_9GAMM|nr:outer membrane lipoprotein chaperone LolA [Shewanella surugensis]MCL1126879.1 outer membrane lipoprotein chaperone LolA [Shewanella surugensis]